MICPACKNDLNGITDNCKTCNFPFNGTEKEKGIHIGKFINEKGVIFDSGESIERSQKILYGITLINLVTISLNYFMNGSNTIDLILNLIVTALIAFCGYKVKEKPIMYSLIALCLLLSIYTFNFLFDPQVFIRGILYKVIIVGGLFYNIYLVINSNSFKKKYNIKA